MWVKVEAFSSQNVCIPRRQHTQKIKKLKERDSDKTYIISLRKKHVYPTARNFAKHHEGALVFFFRFQNKSHGFFDLKKHASKFFVFVKLAPSRRPHPPQLSQTSQGWKACRELREVLAKLPELRRGEREGVSGRSLRRFGGRFRGAEDC